MDDFAKLKPTDQMIVFEGTATQRNMQAHVVEKDFWVCWTLKELFQLPTIGNQRRAFWRQRVSLPACLASEENGAWQMKNDLKNCERFHQ
jgi:hypothetical protein